MLRYNNMKKEIITSSIARTKKIAEKIAQKIIKKRSKNRALVIGLKGDLGGGKTTFVQGLAKGLGTKEKILSPTFVIIKKYEVRSTKKRRKKNLELQTSPACRSGRDFRLYLYHFDCYRIKNPKEILDLGFKEIISNPQNIVVVEWADKIKKIMPENTLWFDFEFINESTRKISSVFNCDK
jgi:tRNA threonylcarbamoyladenosine biosynthesis protein TsaE